MNNGAGDNVQPLDVLPLNYATRKEDTRLPRMRWLGRISIAYGALALGGDATQIAHLWPRIFGFWAVDLVGLILVLLDSIHGYSAAVLVFAGVMLQRGPIRRSLIIRSCWGVIASKLLALLLAICAFTMKQTIDRFGADFLAYRSSALSLSAIFFSLAQQLFVPVLLILLVRRPVGRIN